MLNQDPYENFLGLHPHLFPPLFAFEVHLDGEFLGFRKKKFVCRTVVRFTIRQILRTNFENLLCYLQIVNTPLMTDQECPTIVSLQTVIVTHVVEHSAPHLVGVVRHYHLQQESSSECSAGHPASWTVKPSLPFLKFLGTSVTRTPFVEAISGSDHRNLHHVPDHGTVRSSVPDPYNR